MMERRVRGNSHARCEAGENSEIVSKSYLSLLFLYTKMNNVSGISNAASARASDMQLKIEYINELHGGDKGVVFATGTPISNSMAEMYIMQSYLQKNTLKELGIDYFDGWAADFGETVTALEMAPSGQGYRMWTRFAKFTNLPELMTLYRSFADVQTADMVKLDVPEAERITVTLEPSEQTVQIAEEIAKRAEAIYNGGVDPHLDNMLKVTSDGKKLALAIRCFDPFLKEEGCGEEQHRPDEGPRPHDHQTGAGKNIVGRLLLLLAQPHRDGHGGAHADEVGQGKVDDDKGHGQVDGGEGGVPQHLAHQNTVNELIEGGGQHADGPRQGREHKEFAGRGFGK